jgi:hypothetical protein
MGTTTLNGFTTTWVPYNNFELVYTGSFTLPEEEDYFDLIIGLDTPYNYTGGNLVVMINKTGTDWWSDDPWWKQTEMATARTFFAISDEVVFNPAVSYPVLNEEDDPYCWTDNYVADITLFFGEPPVPPAVGSLTGTVTSGGANLEGVLVSVDGTDFSGTSNAAGVYTIADIPVGTYSITAIKTGYEVYEASDIAIEEDTATNHPINMTALTVTVNISGWVTGATIDVLIPDVNITLSGPGNYSTTSDASGNFSFSNVYGELTYTLTEWRTLDRNAPGGTVAVPGFNPSRPAYFCLKVGYSFYNKL